VLDGDGNVVGQLGYSAGGATPWVAQAQKIVDGARAK